MRRFKLLIGLLTVAVLAWAVAQVLALSYPQFPITAINHSPYTITFEPKLPLCGLKCLWKVSSFAPGAQATHYHQVEMVRENYFLTIESAERGGTKQPGFPKVVQSGTWAGGTVTLIPGLPRITVGTGTGIGGLLKKPFQQTPTAALGVRFTWPGYPLIEFYTDE